MAPRNFQLAIKYLGQNLAVPLSSCEPLPVYGMQIVEILWPLNDIFRPHSETIRIVKYDPRLESKADKAIEDFVFRDKKTWENMPLEIWRVLLERHIQMQVVAIANTKDNNSITRLPGELPESARLGAVMLLLLHSMKLPFPPDDRSLFELPKGNFSSSSWQN